MKAADGAARPNPLGGLYDFVRQHLAIVNSLVLASGTLVAALDFLAPRLSILPRIVYALTFATVLLMLAAALAPALVGRALSAVGVAARRDDLIPLWRRPLWQVAVALLSAVTIAGYASIAKASQGGIIASQSPAMRSWQESMLSLQGAASDISHGVREANDKLDAMAADSRDPQKDLTARGYKVDNNGLMKALKQGDRRAVALFVQAGLRVDKEGPLSVLISAEPWDGELAAMLPRSMFSGGDACATGSRFQWEQKPPVAERVATFKRLCDPAKATAVTEDAIRRDETAPALNEEEARQRAARKINLALLKG